MDFLISFSTGLLLAALLIWVHYGILSGIARLLPRAGLPRRAWVTLVMFAVFLGHTLEIGIYAVAYYALEGTGIGGFTGGFGGTTLDYYRFSAVSFTTLGVGPVEPVGGFGLLSAMEGLTGFSLITWSATFGYSLMRELWQESDSEGDKSAS